MAQESPLIGSADTCGCLDQGEVPVDHLAVELGFPSPGALRNLVKRYTGLSATELRRDGALETVLARLFEALDVARTRQLEPPIETRLARAI